MLFSAYFEFSSTLQSGIFLHPLVLLFPCNQMYEITFGVFSALKYLLLLSNRISKGK